MFENNDDEFGLEREEAPVRHPQYDILKKHIERSVQDMFLSTLRNQPIELIFIFENENQIDGFSDRVLKYWEGLEKYEICSEVIELSKQLKEKWKNRDGLEKTEGFVRIQDIFRSTFKA
jgi:hypothetical protein